jgi:phytoene/squalene synthetase
MDLYHDVCLKTSKLTTQKYSTSFSLGIKLLSEKLHNPIYAIYGFVRYADEIVDTLYGHNQKELLGKFREDTYLAIEKRVSTNPILHSFQWAVHEYSIERELIDAFLNSMEMDLYFTDYSESRVKDYIYGSAEVVGLMCLRVFYQNNEEKYKELSYSARKLGEAFQKVNFLRDIQADFMDRGRNYFPHLKIQHLSPLRKVDFSHSLPRHLCGEGTKPRRIHEV